MKQVNFGKEGGNGRLSTTKGCLTVGANNKMVSITISGPYGGVRHILYLTPDEALAFAQAIREEVE